MDDRLPGIVARRVGRKALLTWRESPRTSRDQIIGEIEEIARESEDLSDAANAAADLLDVAAKDGALDAWSTAVEDVEWLVAEVSRLRGMTRG